MALLDDIGDAVTSAILGADLLYDAIVRRVAVGQDDDGNTTETPTDYPCKGMVENATFRQRSGEGYAEGDMSVLIMRDTVAINAIPSDKFICLGGPWRGVVWRLVSTAGDPAGATAEYGGRRA